MQASRLRAITEPISGLHAAGSPLRSLGVAQTSVAPVPYAWPHGQPGRDQWLKAAAPAWSSHSAYVLATMAAEMRAKAPRRDPRCVLSAFAQVRRGFV